MSDAEWAELVVSIRRRSFLIGGAALVGALAACGSGHSDSDTTGSAPGFPVVVDGALGKTTIARPAKKVVSVGRTDHDALLALGVIPAAVYRFVPAMTKGVGPWALPKLGDASPAILTNPINYELVASLRPDVILDVQSLADEQQYRTLSGIAPTVGRPKGTTPNAVPWQQATALGRAADGQRLARQTNQFLAARAKAHPAFAGRSVAVLLTYGSAVGVYTSGDTRMQLLTALGFVPAPFVKALSDPKFFVDVSAERLDEVDADMVVVLSQTGLLADQQRAKYPTLASIPGYDSGRVVFVSDFDVALALSGTSVLSIPYAVNALEPLLARAVS